jgi:murein DD-endopeptidase MepM/ murein hydrolase activator NlpD
MRLKPAEKGGSGPSGGRGRVYQRGDSMFGQGGGAAALSLSGGLAAFERTPVPAIVQGWRNRLADLDPVVDLGARIGSGEWWRGLATLTALCGAAWALSPGLDPLPAIADAPLAPAQWQEARAIAIAPIAYGADTGRRMAATDAVQPLTDTPERPSIDLTATLGRGDSFARSLERAGVAKGQAGEVAALIAQAIPPSDIKAGTKLDITLGRRANKLQPRPLDHLAFRARFDLKLAVERIDGRLTLIRTPIAVDDTPLRIQGRVGNSLYTSARAAGAPVRAVEAYLKAIGSRLSVNRDIRGEDRFDIIIAHRRAETGETEVGEILYAGLDQGRRKTQLMRWTHGGRKQWFEASGVGETTGALAAPVANPRQTSGFGMRRHPLLGFSRFHKGLDFGAPSGTPIMAVTDGRVAYAGRNRGYGNYVKLDHAGGLATAYGHMSRIAVRSGEQVRRGEVIGYVGSTGLSTGPHLHYEVYRNGAAINPRSISFTTTTRLAGGELGRFKAELNGLLAVKPGARAEAVQTAAKKDGKTAG